MLTRPVLHDTENEAEAKTYEAEATKFGLEIILVSALDDLTSLILLSNFSGNTPWADLGILH